MAEIDTTQLTPELRLESTTVAVPPPSNLSPNMQQINEQVEELFILALKVAKKHLNSNIATLQVPIVRTLLTAATKMMGQGQDTSQVEVKKALEELFGGMRVINVIETTGEEST